MYGPIHRIGQKYRPCSAVEIAGWPMFCMSIPSGGLTVRSFFDGLVEHGLDKDDYVGEREIGSALPWDIVQSGVSESYFHYELRLASRSETGLSCPPDSAGCLSCQACDPDWAFRFGSNEDRPIPAAKGGPWRAEDWRPWSSLKRKNTGV